jgi:hypothetical protein
MCSQQCLVDELRSIDPILGTAVPVCDRQTPDQLIANDVGNVIGKDLEIYPPGRRRGTS